MSIRWVWLVEAIDPKQTRGNERKTQKQRGEERDIETAKYGRDKTKSQIETVQGRNLYTLSL